MYATRRWMAGVTIALAVSGCASSIEVRTIEAPDAGLATLRSFRFLPGPVRRDGGPPTGADDPMISTSIANRVIREAITRSFQDRGYTFDERDADVAVAFYATSREKMDVTLWDYGYPFYPGWPRSPRTTPVATPYADGSVIVDVVRAGTRQLLWRGEGHAELGSDPAENVKRLEQAAEAIVAHFPVPTKRVVAERR